QDQNSCDLGFWFSAICAIGWWVIGVGGAVARPRDDRQKDLLRSALEKIIDLGHPLVRLAREIDWGFLARSRTGGGRYHGAAEKRSRIRPMHWSNWRGATMCHCGRAIGASPNVPRYAHAHQFTRARRALKFLRIRLGRVIGDIRRKIAGNEALQQRFADLLALAVRVRFQDHRQCGPKVYALHAPEVECIGKGKARAPYEFGCKVSIATPATKPKGGQFVL